MGGHMVHNHMAPSNLHNQQPSGNPSGMKMSYGEDPRGRDGNGSYFNADKEGFMMVSQQPKIASIPMTRNQPDPRISQNVAPIRAGGLNNGVGPAVSHMYNHAGVGDNVPAPFISFEATGFPPEILREVRCDICSRRGSYIVRCTAIWTQYKVTALSFRTEECSGKTLGYLMPAFMHLRRCRNRTQNGPTVLVIAPTRELATQIQDEAVKFGRSSRVICTCLYGVVPKGPQLRDLERGVDIVVATPGRLNDILEMRKIDFCQISLLVLDEADRMLDMCFEPQIRKIVNEIPPRRQTPMYTATWPKEVKRIAGDLLVNPVQVNIGNVDELAANKAITQRTCDQLARSIGRSFGAAAIHGDKSQGERDYVLNQFRSGKSPILVATDVAARGLDIKDIRVVVNYDFPTGIEDYVHRTGRTGRAGATGLAYTFFCDQDRQYAADLVKLLEGANQEVPPEVRNMAGGGSEFWQCTPRDESLGFWW
ncbi:hypothetical protein C5167_041268 [Papaver somniferum]|uniref:RNA helicase n=1 Tax=Papaver somniferum TaxID=3469 RepID=A0A4Y7IKR3_PAPSO|nr:hypothetical protein C5167_041268 [Papaver somniferum]